MQKYKSKNCLTMWILVYKVFELAIYSLHHQNTSSEYKSIDKIGGKYCINTKKYKKKPQKNPVKEQSTQNK